MKISSNLFRIFFVGICFLSLQVSIAQNTKDEDNTDDAKLSYGLNVGFYFPSNHTANFYNGSPTNENKIDLILRNKYYLMPIEQQIGYVVDTVTPYTLPTNMKYTPAANLGFYLRYQLAKDVGVFAEINITKLTAGGIYFLNLHLPQNYSLDPTYKDYPIWGVEKRTTINIGLSRIYPLQDIMKLFVEPGINISNTRVVENKIKIEDQTYSIVNNLGSQAYIPGSTQQTYEVIQGGVGFGIFLTSGVKFVFSENISVDPGVTFYWQQINLGKYDGFKPAFNPFVRFTFKKLI
jgi:hypothetical protein